MLPLAVVRLVPGRCAVPSALQGGVCRPQRQMSVMRSTPRYGPRPSRCGSGSDLPPLTSTKRSAGAAHAKGCACLTHFGAGVHWCRRGTRHAREQLAAKLEDERVGNSREAHLLQVLADLLHGDLVRGRTLLHGVLGLLCLLLSRHSAFSKR
jgi:hypothetical protein